MCCLAETERGALIIRVQYGLEMGPENEMPEFEGVRGICSFVL